MNTYVKPIIEVNEDLAEGVYAASGVDGNGDTDCWTIDGQSVQAWDGSSHVFQIRLSHSDLAHHISAATYVTLTFNYPVVNARSEYETSYSGNTVTVVRTLLGDAYQSGDLVTYKVWVQGADEATTKAMALIGATVSCDRQVNVQGRG